MIRYFAFALLLGSCTVWATADAAYDAPHLRDLKGVWRANFNSDASVVVVQLRSGALGLWKTGDGHALPGDLGTLAAQGTYVMDESAQRILVGFKEGGSQVFSLADGQALSPWLEASFVEETWPRHAIFSPDGTQVIIIGSDDSCHVYEADTGDLLATLSIKSFSAPDTQSTPLAAFSRDGRNILILDGEHTLRRFDTVTWEAAGEPMPHPFPDGYVYGFAISDDARYAATFDAPGENGPDGHLQLWDTTTSRALGKPLSGQNGMRASFIDGGSRLVVQPGRGESRVVHVPSLEVDFVLPRHDDVDATKAVVTADERHILTWGYDSFLRNLAAATGTRAGNYLNRAQLKKIITGPDPDQIWLTYDNSAFFSRRYADYYVVRMNIQEMKPAATLRVIHSLHRTILSPDGSLLMITESRTGHERIIRLFDAKTLTELPVTTEVSPPGWNSGILTGLKKVEASLEYISQSIRSSMR